MQDRQLPDSTEIEDDPRRFFWAITHYRRWLSAAFPNMAGDCDISLQQLTVLYLIRTQGASMADIARQMMVAPTVVTGLVDRLETRGLLRREHDTRDRRKVRLILTDQGERGSIEVETTLSVLINRSIEKLTTEERGELSRGLELLSRVINDLEAGLERTS